MTDIERTLREEKWVPIDEVRTQLSDSLLGQALRVFDHDSWAILAEEMGEKSAFGFFNPEMADFSHSKTWEELAAETGIPSYGYLWRIEKNALEELELFMRAFRYQAHCLGWKPRFTSWYLQSDRRATRLNVEAPRVSYETILPLAKELAQTYGCRVEEHPLSFKIYGRETHDRT